MPRPFFNVAAATGGAEAKAVIGLPISTGRSVNGVASDRLDTIYFISGGAVWRYSVARRTGELSVNSGLLLASTTYPFSFNNGATAGIALDPSGTLWVGTDPGTGVIGQGRAWMMATP